MSHSNWQKPRLLVAPAEISRRLMMHHPLPHSPTLQQPPALDNAHGAVSLLIVHAIYCKYPLTTPGKRAKPGQNCKNVTDVTAMQSTNFKNNNKSEEREVGQTDKLMLRRMGLTTQRARHASSALWAAGTGVGATLLSASQLQVSSPWDLTGVPPPEDNPPAPHHAIYLTVLAAWQCQGIATGWTDVGFTISLLLSEVRVVSELTRLGLSFRKGRHSGTFTFFVLYCFPLVPAARGYLYGVPATEWLQSALFPGTDQTMLQVRKLAKQNRDSMEANSLTRKNSMKLSEEKPVQAQQQQHTADAKALIQTVRCVTVLKRKIKAMRKKKTDAMKEKLE
ncbi:hypothetical protein B566_EDAN005465 [Ephemera danica]|nr:hypothetical protein B566_EDAN005465 [Ephemera danica]